MAKRTTKIKLPIRNPEAFLTLCEDIISYNTALGAASPFADGTLVDMPAFANTVTRARQKREEALEHYAIAKAALGESKSLIGVRRGQTSLTPDTLHNGAARIKKMLQVLNSENPEALSRWGFEVVVRMAKNPGRRKKK